MVEALGDQLLAGTTLADDEHGAVERRGTARSFHRIEEGGGLADQLSVALHCQELGHFTTAWQEKSGRCGRQQSDFRGFPPLPQLGTPLVKEEACRREAEGEMREEE